MPAGDRTGPMGFGAMIGRGMGYCGGGAGPGWMNPMPRRRRGADRGRGRQNGWRHGYRAAGLSDAPPARGAGPAQQAGPSSADETIVLQARAKQLEDMLADIKRRLTELAAGSPT